MGNLPRKPTTLEILLLVLIGKAGLTSIYSLRQQAGLSWGGIRPSLLRLQQWNWIAPEPPKDRRRRDFRLTEGGKGALAGGWQDALDPAAELDTIVRGAWIASQFNPQLAVGFVSVAADQRDAALGQEVGGRPVTPDALADYRWIHSFSRERRLRLEAGLLRELADALAARYLPGATESPERRQV